MTGEMATKVGTKREKTVCLPGREEEEESGKLPFVDGMRYIIRGTRCTFML